MNKSNLIINISSKWLGSKQDLFELGFNMLGKQRETID